MSVSVEVPTLGESVTQAFVAEWKKAEGDYIEEDEILAELETDKITVEVPAPVSGTISSLKAEIDAEVEVGEVIAEIEPGEREESDEEPETDDADEAEETEDSGDADQADESDETDTSDAGLSPAVQRLVDEHDLDPADIDGSGPGGRILKGDVLDHVDQKDKAAKSTKETRTSVPTSQREERVGMSKLRQTIAGRLVDAQNDTASLTTFQEVDMSQVMELRNKYKEKYADKHGIKLGFMSFFVKACIEALKEYPAVNGEIDGDEIVYKNYYNIGVAVGSGKGLVVPVIKDADAMSFAEIELGIKEKVEKVRNNKLTMDDLQGGTFTITNGGIYGSMLSTPILNPPQSAILGMHNIVDRPVAVDGEVEIRPIMYLALTYDHRIIDGREAVSFLYRVKECIEDPERILLEI
jgi:2-oxoglutarate dehydrogenase E2 component (dihydrolipoamide succinyltransferase)